MSPSANVMEQFQQVPGKRRSEYRHSSLNRVLELQLLGVKRHPPEKHGRLAVALVADEGMTEFRELDANLVLSPRFQLEPQQRRILEALRHVPVRHGRLAFVRIARGPYAVRHRIHRQPAAKRA